MISFFDILTFWHFLVFDIFTFFSNIPKLVFPMGKYWWRDGLDVFDVLTLDIGGQCH